MSQKANTFHNQDFLPFVRPHFSDEAIADVVECLKGGWIATGPRVQAFEQDLRSYLDAPHALTLTSGTDALFMVLNQLKLQPGDEVIVPSMTFVASTNTILSAGGTPIFAEIDSTYNMDVSKIEALITSKTRAIMPVHFSGLPVDMAAINELAKQYKLRVIEDAAQAMGAHYDGKIIGSFGDIQCFSFQAAKNITTIEGGCITTRDAAVAQKIKTDRFHGIDRDAWNRYAKEGSHLYDVIDVGFKNNMSDISATLGIHQLKTLEERLEKKRIIAERYMMAMHDWESLTLPKLPAYNFRHAWQLFAVCINPEVTGFDRDIFMSKMKERNIGAGLHYQPVHLFSFYKNKYPTILPLTENIGQRIVSLPFFPEMMQSDQDHVIDTMYDILEKGK